MIAKTNRPKQNSPFTWHSHSHLFDTCLLVLLQTRVEEGGLPRVGSFNNSGTSLRVLLYLLRVLLYLLRVGPLVRDLVLLVHELLQLELKLLDLLHVPGNE